MESSRLRLLLHFVWTVEEYDRFPRGSVGCLKHQSLTLQRLVGCQYTKPRALRVGQCVVRGPSNSNRAIGQEVGGEGLSMVNVNRLA